MNVSLSQLVEVLFTRPDTDTIIEIPFTVTEPDATTAGVLVLELISSEVNAILQTIKRAVNRAQIATGAPPIFTRPEDFPDPDEELRVQARRVATDLLQVVQEEDDLTTRLKHIQELNRTLSLLRPDIRIKDGDWRKILSVLKRLKPDISEDEALGMF